MNAESLCIPKDQPEKEREGEGERKKEREKKKNTGLPSFFERGPLLLFSKGTFIPQLVHRGK